jgi:hypothetical protein
MKEANSVYVMRKMERIRYERCGGVGSIWSHMVL